jgi:hypothetical protein
MLTPIDHWHALLGAEDPAPLCATLADRMRERRLRFGDRIICPFLRPFFLDVADEPRVRHVVETLWASASRASRSSRRKCSISSRSARRRSAWRASTPVTPP